MFFLNNQLLSQTSCLLTGCDSWILILLVTCCVIWNKTLLFHGYGSYFLIWNMIWTLIFLNGYPSFLDLFHPYIANNRRHSVLFHHIHNTCLQDQRDDGYSVTSLRMMMMVVLFPLLTMVSVLLYQWSVLHGYVIHINSFHLKPELHHQHLLDLQTQQRQIQQDFLLPTHYVDVHNN